MTNLKIIVLTLSIGLFSIQILNGMIEFDAAQFMEIIDHIVRFFSGTHLDSGVEKQPANNVGMK